tara:strand:+ start:164 stop:493 length:330 start_codon:yes stop_codon:yes gene_type:complete
MSLGDHNLSQEPTKLRSALDVLLKKLSGSSLAAIEVVIVNWSEIIEDSLYPYCKPVSIQGGSLTIVTSDPALSEEIYWQSEKILTKSNSFLKDQKITQIKVSFVAEEHL